MPADRPHLVIVNPDQWRADVLGCHGNPAAQTPNLDQLVAHDAVSFRNAFCQNPVCTPSRCSFMSGWYPHVRGHRSLHHMMQPDEPVLLKTLKDSGYFVWWGGKNDLVPAHHGFGAYCDVKFDADTAGRPVQPFAGFAESAAWRGDPDATYSFYAGRTPTAPGEVYYDLDWALFDGAIATIRDWGRRRDDRPLCLYLPLIYPHPPYGVEEPWFSAIDRAALPPRLPAVDEGKPLMEVRLRAGQRLERWGEARWDELRAAYYGMCARVDHQVGLLIAALREAGMYDDTALFLFADHGDFTGDYGLVEKTQNSFADCLTGVPFVIKPPADVPVRPGVRDALVELVDFPATVEALTGITPGHTHFGRSLLPVIAGETDGHRDAVFCEGGRLPGEVQASEVESTLGLTPDNPYWPRLQLQTQSWPEHGKATMCRTADFKYVRRLFEPDELYDLTTDPGELHNVATDPAYAEVRAELAERMLSWYQETADAVPFATDRRE